MKTSEIIKDIRQIYQRFPVPDNLEFHLIGAAAVGSIISDNWRGPDINRDDLIAYLLLHDLGNIVKYDFSRRELLTAKMLARIGHWEKVQQETREKFGRDDHEATLTMAREIGVSGRIISLLEQDDFRNMSVVAEGSDWEQKIGKYADYRSGPLGIVSLAHRLSDLKARYAGKPAISHDPELVQLSQAMFTIEKQIVSHLRIQAEDITEERAEPYRKRF